MKNLASLVAGAALKALFGETLETAGSLLATVRDHYRAHGNLIDQAMSQACDQAFQALEIALGGQSFLGKMAAFATSFAASTDDSDTAAQLKTFLAEHPLTASPDAKAAMLASLRHARLFVWRRRYIGRCWYVDYGRSAFLHLGRQR